MRKDSFYMEIYIPIADIAMANEVGMTGRYFIIVPAIFSMFMASPPFFYLIITN